MSTSRTVTIQPRLPMPAGLTITPPQWRVLCDAIFPAAKSPEAIVLALDYCAARHLDPFKRPVHIVPMWNSSLRREVETVWPGINELQVTAARTGQWAGMDEPKWGETVTRTFKGTMRDGSPREITLEFPLWCSVTVWRMIHGQKAAFSEPVYWEEAYARMGSRSELPNDMWAKRARGQLHKCAKAASLRAAFPEEAGNDYVAEEMEGKEIAAGGIVIEGSAEKSEPISPVDRVLPTAPVVPETSRQRTDSPDKKQTVAQFLDELELEMAHAVTEGGEAVDAILARPRVQEAQDRLTNGAKDRLDHILGEAIRRTAAAETTAPNDGLYANPADDPFYEPLSVPGAAGKP